MILDAIRSGLSRLLAFHGRDRPARFWPYAGFVVGLFAIAVQVWTMPVQMKAWTQAIEILRDPANMPPPPPPEQGLWGISPFNPDNPMAPDYRLASGGMPVLAILVGIGFLLLAAAIVRRLHDRDRSGLWGLLPLPFLAAIFALTATAGAPLGTLLQTRPALLVGAMAAGLLYAASTLYLLILLGGAGTAGANRFGPAPGGGEEAIDPPTP